MLTLNHKLKQLRTERKWTQYVLAEKSGVSQSFISALELGNKQPTLDIIKKLATALNVSITTLIE